MTNEVKLSHNRMLRVVDYNTNIDIYVFDSDENEAIYHKTIYWDSCIEYTAQENMESCMEDICEDIKLTDEDVEILKNTLRIPIASMSSNR